MSRRYMGPWMWADAMQLLEQAERLQRQFFHTSGRTDRRSGNRPSISTSAATVC